MAKFSVAVEDEREGPSSSRAKRMRIPCPQDISDFVLDSSQEDDVQQTSLNDDEQEQGEEESTTNVGRNINKPVPLTLTDPEVFDCNICCEPLTIPVFQCENGHTACSICCKRIAHKCPSCSLPIGYNRCRAIEKVLESVQVPCQNSNYGCREMVAYSKKSDHGKTCAYIPCKCPISGCNFLGSSKHLGFHVKSKHVGSAISFSFDCPIPVFCTKDTRFLVLQEEGEGILFIVNNIAQDIGNMIVVCCMESSSVKGRYYYELTAKSGESMLKFASFMESIQCKLDTPLSAGFLLAPSSFFGSHGQITLKLRVWRFSTSASLEVM